MEISTEIIIKDREYDIEFEATDIEVGNDGIGGYECWGYRGYDKGRDYVEDFKVEDLKVFRCGRMIKVTPKLQQHIERVVKYNGNVFEELTERYLNQEPDAF